MTVSPSIKIEIRNVYGEEKAYPVCTDAKVFADIAGTKTLTQMTLRRVLALGYSLAVVDRYGQVCRTFAPHEASTLPAVR